MSFFAFDFDFATDSPPPLASEIRLNNADQTLATVIAISKTTNDGLDATAALIKIHSGARIRIQNWDDSSKWQRYVATGAATDQGTYVTAPIAFDAGGAALLAARTSIYFSEGGSTEIAHSSLVGLAEGNDHPQYALDSEVAAGYYNKTTSDARYAPITASSAASDLRAVFDGQGSILQSGVKTYIPITQDCILTAGVLVADVAGSVTVSVGHYTPSAGSLGTITPMGTLALAGAQHLHDTALFGFTLLSASAGDVFEIALSGTPANMTWLTVVLGRTLS